MKNVDAFLDIACFPLSPLDSPSPFDTSDTLLAPWLGVRNGSPLGDDDEPVCIVDSETVGDCSVLCERLNMEELYTVSSFGGGGGGAAWPKEGIAGEDPSLKTLRVENRDFVPTLPLLAMGTEHQRILIDGSAFLWGNCWTA